MSRAAGVARGVALAELAKAVAARAAGLAPAVPITAR